MHISNYFQTFEIMEKLYPKRMSLRPIVGRTFDFLRRTAGPLVPGEQAIRHE